jgi:polyisoprenoid-binding protein YceI
MARAVRIVCISPRAAAVAAAVVLLFAHARAETRKPIDTTHSTITVRVGKSGVFRAFGDDHEIRAAVKRGFIDEEARTVEMSIETAQLRVLDPNLSAKDRDEVQTKMLGADVLDAGRFPEIHFASTAAEKTPSGWLVRGPLTLHGRTLPVSATVRQEADRYTGSMRVKQTDFGITPVTVAGGAVKVKDEVTIDFDLRVVIGTG